MAPITYAHQLEDVRAALAAVELPRQGVKVDGGQVTRGDRPARERREERPRGLVQRDGRAYFRWK